MFYSTDKWTDIDIIANAILMFVAGSETVSTLTCFCLYELALNKEVQDRLREEIVTTKAKYGGNMNNDFLTDLRYMNMVLEGIINNNIHVYYITNDIDRTTTDSTRILISNCFTLIDCV